MNYICIYSKPPIPGKTKRRLAQEISDINAAGLAKSMLQDICRTMSLVSGTEVQIWHPPEYNSTNFKSIIYGNVSFFKQHGINLGERMSDTFQNLLTSKDKNKAVIIGSDCITHSAEEIENAFSTLNSTDVIIQPSEDGGYVLVGQSKWIPNIFKNIEWGTDRVMNQTIRQIEKYAINFKELPKSFDIDNARDLDKLKIFIQNNDRPNTMKWFSQKYSG